VEILIGNRPITDKIVCLEKRKFKFLLLRLPIFTVKLLKITLIKGRDFKNIIEIFEILRKQEISGEK